MSSDLIFLEISQDLQSAKDDQRLYNPINFETRVRAIDFIDFHIINRIDIIHQNSTPNPDFTRIRRSAEELKEQLEAINRALFAHLRETIKSKKLYPSELNELLISHLDNAYNREADQPGYDYLDELINGILCESTLPEPTIVREPEMVFYQQTPARIIFKLAEMLQVDEVLYDLGSGLGHVPILINLLNGNKTVGVEFEPAYHRYAVGKATQLKLNDVLFINEDARKVDYTNGTVFYLYTPFEGNILQEVLDKLKQESFQKPIRIFTYGPCSFQLAKQSWLICSDTKVKDIYKLYEFRSYRDHRKFIEVTPKGRYF
ncbi:hypothetical protein [Mucilaginibacter agri]|uniref:DOT1 domain-containing protein n=1 Tax=Mucilaginibacter agri TaxID=2695265 RepID=A0A965ZLV3_9SPHI|nr:hypothetical protein [Mucilaginibacter agri]NCD72076.1 hypothetical protein [Mucilaginibacter agri]